MRVDLDAVRQAYALPGSVEVVSHHHGADGVWRVRSGGRDFALKVTGTTEPGEWRATHAWYQAQLEQAAAEAGLRVAQVVRPAFPVLDIFADVNGHLVQLHHWVDTLPAGHQIEPDVLHVWLGRTLAALHQLIPVPDPVDLDGAYALHPVSDWASWVDQAHRQGQPWASVADELVPLIPKASVLIRDGLADLTLPRCVTHRDVNPSNVLHTLNGPVLCDFGYAGPDVGWLEVVSTTISFDAPGVLTAYLAAGGRPGPTTTSALARAVGSTLNWLAFNMWLSLGHRDVDDDVRRQATDRVTGICRDVTLRLAHPESDRQALFTD